MADERLRAARAELEQRVEQRTAELDVTNEELRATNEELRVEFEQRQQAERLRVEAVRRIASVQEEERRRISREIHDELGQHLARRFHTQRCEIFALRADFVGANRDERLLPGVRRRLIRRVVERRRHRGKIPVRSIRWR